jgi:hypothetical protein
MRRSASYRRGDRLGRVTVGVTGLVLVLAGGAALTRSLGVWDSTAGAGRARRSRSPLVTPDVSRFVADHGAAFWSAAAVVGLLLALLGYHLLRAELRTRAPRAPVVDLTDDARQGVTYAETTVLTRAFVDELADIPGVEQAAADLRGDPARPLIDVRLDVADDADLEAVLDAVEEEALRHLCESFDLQPAATTVEVRLVEPSGTRLR